MLISPETKKKSLRAIGLLIFLLSIGEGMVAPAIPLLGNHLGASYSLIGFFMTGYAITYAIMTILSGRFSDLLGRKSILFFGLAFCFTASLGYCFASNPTSLLIFRTLEGAGRGILWVVLEAILADNTSLDNRSGATARFTSAYGLGALLGCLIGGALMEKVSLYTVFPFYPVLCLLGFFVAAGITERPKSHVAYQDKASGRQLTLWHEVKNIWPLCYVYFTYSGFLYSIWGLLSLVADYFHVSYLGIGLVFALFWACRIAAFLGSGIIAGKIGRKSVLIWGIIFSGASAAVFMISGNFWYIALASTLGGIGTGILFTLCISMAADLVSPDNNGFAMGLLEFSGSFGMIAQTAVSGLLGQFGGIKLTYSFTLIVCLLGIVIVGAFIRTGHRSDQRSNMFKKVNE